MEGGSRERRAEASQASPKTGLRNGRLGEEETGREVYYCQICLSQTRDDHIEPDPDSLHSLIRSLPTLVLTTPLPVSCFFFLFPFF